MKSILQNDKECLICKSPYVECHHVFEGSRRQKSDKYGLTVWLCRAHHTGTYGVHFNTNLERKLKVFAQKEFEKKYGHDFFMREFGKNYLWMEDEL